MLITTGVEMVSIQTFLQLLTICGALIVAWKP